MKKTILLTFFLILNFEASWAGTNSLSIRPFPWPDFYSKSISKNQTTTAYYIVANHSQIPQKGNYIRYLPPNVKQVTKGGAMDRTCGNYFDLKENTSMDSSCILQLTISGAVDSNDPDPKHHITICQGASDCIVINKKDELNIIVDKPNILARTAIVNSLRTSQGTRTWGPISYLSTDGGIGWASKDITGSRGRIRAITCNNNLQRCVAVGDSYESGTTTDFIAYTSTDGGQNWTSHAIERHGGASGLSSVTCNGTNYQHCIAVGGFSKLTPDFGPSPIVYLSTDGGNNWTSRLPEKLGKFQSSLRAVSCSGDEGQFCTAIGEFNSGYEDKHNTTTFIAYNSKDGGNTWSPANIINKFIDPSYLKSIRCYGNNGQNCIAIGYITQRNNNQTQPIIYTSKDAGVTWTSYIPKEDNGGILKALTCGGKNNQYCMAAGGYYRNRSSSITDPIVYTSSDGGMQWAAQRVFGGVGIDSRFESIACTGENAQYCTLLGYRTIQEKSKIKTIPIIYSTVDKGANWFWKSNAFANEGDSFDDIEIVGISLGGE